ncbi:glycosyltransferase family 2 protein [Plebeiibacterium sediminum]|uniref:Glycosyltransferase family 2 protein n=1 Tax=Plebeiibacterium sediminum TaxID=2992112 RepID=A0AAE3SGM6_9BACT|nr:glycosyltransferase family 2 protein [Plebeiobacterium sediminum]MCW3788267.1 glycosyltransferase family 2 protein [Plebeiobacterium sediminum]
MNPLFSKYLERHTPFTKFDSKSIKESDLVVVIPVFLEKDICKTLDSLKKCNPIPKHVAVVLVVNAGVNAAEDIIVTQEQTIVELDAYSTAFNNEHLSFYTVKAFDLPRKHFGAGLARKIGMDLAIQHFFDHSNDNGIIVSLDADTMVEENYFTEIYHWFNRSHKRKACSIYYEHPIEGDEFDEEIYQAVTQYELYLRYYVSALKVIGFPYAYHTVGSCFAVHANAYVKVGGMNRRQGGEEFYFIQKLVQMGGYGELNSTIVKPSSRISERVPFGTGPSIKNIVTDEEDYSTYNPTSFFDLKVLFDSVEEYYAISEEEYQSKILELPGRVRSFLLNSSFWEEINNLSENCSNVEAFKKRFYHVFNAFKLVKYLNYTHEHFIGKIPVFDAAIELLEYMQYNTDDFFEERELLLKFREIQKGEN